MAVHKRSSSKNNLIYQQQKIWKRGLLFFRHLKSITTGHTITITLVVVIVVIIVVEERKPAVVLLAVVVTASIILVSRIFFILLKNTPCLKTSYVS